MALRLRIVSDHRHALGPRSQIVFGVGGGTIGRSVENDWVLQDNSRFVSSRHARISFRDGSWFLEDISTNGTFLNDGVAALPKQTPCELNNGDLLRIGEYVVAVAIDGEGTSNTAPSPTLGADTEIALLESGTEPVSWGPPAEPAPMPRRAQVQPARTASAVVAGNVVSTSSTSGALAPQVVGHLGTTFDASTLFARIDGKLPAVGGNALDDSGGLAVGGAFGQAAVLPFSTRTPATPAESDDPIESSDVIAARRMERLQKIVAEREAAHAPPPPALPPTAAETRPGLEALCRGAGLDHTLLHAEAGPAMLQLAGRLLRELVIGLKEIDLEQRSQLARMHVETVDNNRPSAGFDLATAGDELLMQLLASHDSRRLDAALWVRQVLQGVKRHEAQFEAGMRSALTQLLAQLEPKGLETRFERSANRNLMGARPANWELYREFFRSLCETGADGPGMPHTFIENFVAAYRGETQDGGAN